MVSHILDRSAVLNLSLSIFQSNVPREFIEASSGKTTFDESNLLSRIELFSGPDTTGDIICRFDRNSDLGFDKTSKNGFDIQTKRDIITEMIESNDDETIFYDGLDPAILGTVTTQGSTRVVYDIDQIIRILMRRDGMDYEEAVEFYSFNIECMYVGETTPLLLSSFDQEISED